MIIGLRDPNDLTESCSETIIKNGKLKYCKVTAKYNCDQKPFCAMHAGKRAVAHLIRHGGALRTAYQQGRDDMLKGVNVFNNTYYGDR